MGKVLGAPGVKSGFKNFECPPEKARELYNYTERAKEAVRKVGLPDITPPVLETEHSRIFPGAETGSYFDGELPTIVRNFTYDELSALYGLCQKWYSYILNEEAYWNLRKKEMKKKLEFTSTFVRKSYTVDDQGNKISDALAKDLTKIDTRVVEAEAEYDDACNIALLFEVRHKSAFRNVEMISREITIRGQKLQADKQGRGFNDRIGYVARDYDEAYPQKASEERFSHDFRASQDTGERIENAEAPKPSSRRKISPPKRANEKPADFRARS